MAEEEEVVLLKPDEGQRTLFSLAKVVRLGASQVCFTPADIEALKAQLLEVTATKHQLLNALRKLDCFKLEPQDMYVSGISAAVATLAARHPKPDVSRLATSLLQKWRDIVETALFQPQEYDAKAAAAAPDGESECPEDLIAAELEVARRERAERRRQRLEEDIMASDSEEDEIVPMSQEEDPDWAPIAGSKPGGKRSKSGWATRSRVSTRAQAGSGDDDGGGFHDVVVEDGAVDVAPIIVPEPPKTATMHPFFRNLLAAGKQPR